MNPFHDIRLPVQFGFGAQASLERRTEILLLGSGRESRNALWARARRRFDIGPSIQTLERATQLMGFFEARMGRLYAFRFRDFTDFSSGAVNQPVSPLDQMLAPMESDPRRFQLRKAYRSGPGEVFRDITLPLAETLRVAVNGTEARAGSDFTLDPLSGRLTFVHAPQAGAVVSAGFAFDIAVRFEADRLDIALEAPNAARAISVGLIEVLP